MSTKYLLAIIGLLIPSILFSQQTVRGTILDADAGTPIPFATIQIVDSLLNLGAVGDEDGKFRLENVPLGKHQFIISSVGYETAVLSNIEVSAAKEVLLEIELAESFNEIEEVLIVANKDESNARNEFTTTSVHTLRMEVINRYTAAVEGPARKALNFAGVNANGFDLFNEIVIRGNSPRGLLWRLEGIEIPNPNHFASLGSSGGGVSMLSNNILANSDFYTGAFPGEYGNALSGVFDLKYRKGNNENYETKLSLGFLGAEITSEGPLNKERGASYVFNYRYSTLGILNALGIRIVGQVLPVYQDLNFHFHLPSSKFGIFNIYGLGGTSNYEYDSGGFYLQGQENHTGVIGVKNTLFLSPKTYLKTNINYSYQESRLNNRDTWFEFLIDEKDNYKTHTWSASSLINHKFNPRHTLQMGLIFRKMSDIVRQEAIISNRYQLVDTLNPVSNQLQSYIQWKWRFSQHFTLNTGAHYLYHQYLNQSTIDPRIGLRWQYSPKLALSIAGGLHSRAESLYAYAAAREKIPINPSLQNLTLTKAAHIVLGHEWNIKPQTRLKVELYYQYLYDVPVDSVANFSTINATEIIDFNTINQLSTNGTGRNYGIEFTLERFPHKNIYYLSTLSLFQSQFSFGNGQYFNSRYNNQFIFNFLIGKEYPVGIKNQNTFGMNFKMIFSGGQRYTNYDDIASKLARGVILSRTPFTEQIPSYFRIDAAIYYTFNIRKTTQRISFNVQNLTNRLNKGEPYFYFNIYSRRVFTNFITQSGIIPVLKYSIDF